MKEKLFLGGLGGLMPLVASFIIVDVETIASYIENFNSPGHKGIILFCGYFLKALLLFGVGALWAYLHSSEENLLKIFQLGIVAPAIISGFIQSSHIKELREKYYGTVINRESNIQMFGNSAFAATGHEELTQELAESIAKNVVSLLAMGFLSRIAIETQTQISSWIKLRLEVQEIYKECLGKEVEQNRISDDLKIMMEIGRIKFMEDLCLSTEGQVAGCKFVNSQCIR
jgi:hypothetical protein